MPTSPNKKTSPAFTPYQVLLIAILALLQFTVILDFMVLSPLGAILMDELSIVPRQFGTVVSVYAFSAGASGLLAAGFADKFDRKKILLFFYTGFLIGTLFCGIAPDYHFLLAARIVTGIFGGVIGSVTFAIVTDLFEANLRGRVLGYVQMAFASSQVLGIPAGIFLANQWGWHSPFLLIVGLGVFLGLAILFWMKPVTDHLKFKNRASPLASFGKIFANKWYLRAFATTVFLSTGGFMLMPFGSAFSVHNLGISMEQLPLLYLVPGIANMFIGPIVGVLSDRLGKYPMFVAGSILNIIVTAIYTNLGITPIWILIIINVLFFTGITSRMVSGSALMTSVPDAAERGGFMSVNSSLQQISGGIASYVAGLIVVEQASGKLENYEVLGYIVIASVVITVIFMYFLDKHIKRLSTRKIPPLNIQTQEAIP